MRIVIFICLTACLAVAACGQSTPNNSLLGEASSLVAAGRLDEALRKLETLAAERPEPLGTEYLRGMVFYQQNKMAEAVDAFANAAAQEPENLDAKPMEGVSLFRAGRPSEAIPLLERTRRPIKNANVDPNYVLGLCYMDTRRYEDARKAFASQYGFAPDSAAAYLLAARMLLRRDYLPVAEETARKAVALDPRLAQAHLLLGEIALSREDLPNAIILFQRELELNPLDGVVYERLGDAYVRSGDFDNAQQALNRAVLLEPNANIPFILLAKVLLKQQNPLMARMYLERALQIDPNNYMAHYLLGQSYRLLGRATDATREYHAAEQLQGAGVTALTPSQ